MAYFRKGKYSSIDQKIKQKMEIGTVLLGRLVSYDFIEIT